jgi:5-(carboxyamino)imidazole ribonucleotide synthase
VIRGVTRERLPDCASQPRVPSRVDNSSANPPAIGVVGGGQLAWMLAAAARDLGVPLQVQTPSPDDPAVALASGVVLAAVDDCGATAELASRCSALSFENEWIPLDRLAALEQGGVRFLPSLAALRPLVCKRRQRELLGQLHLPCPRWAPLAAVLMPQEPPDSAQGEGGFSGVAWHGSGAASATALAPARSEAAPQQPRLPDGFGFPLMAKACTGGYDGKGTLPIPDQAALEALLERVDPEGWILEEMVAFELELALTAARNAEGTVVVYPLVQTQQHHQVCDWVLFPAPVSHAVEAFARNVAASLLTALDYVGVLSIEFFHGPAGLQVNEIAPRTHNSAHYTIEACRCSQFEQQVRIVAGLTMGLSEPVLPGALMVNLLGFETLAADDPAADYSERRDALAALPGASLHWYGKRGSQPGRKLGHLTLALAGAGHSEREAERQQLLAAVREIWPLPA